MTQASFTGSAMRASSIRPAVKGRHAMAPTRQASQVTWSADTSRRTGFWIVTPAAYKSAARRQSATPSGVDDVAVPSADVATPMITAPANATAHPVMRRWEPFTQEQPSEQRDEDGADGDEHRRSPGVDESFRLIEDDVVAREPGDAGGDDEGEMAATRWGPWPG